MGEKVRVTGQLALAAPGRACYGWIYLTPDAAPSGAGHGSVPGSKRIGAVWSYGVSGWIVSAAFRRESPHGLGEGDPAAHPARSGIVRQYQLLRWRAKRRCHCEGDPHQLIVPPHAHPGRSWLRPGTASSTSTTSQIEESHMSVPAENSAGASAIRAFTMPVTPEADIEALRARIAATRWPEMETDADQ